MARMAAAYPSLRPLGPLTDRRHAVIARTWRGAVRAADAEAYAAYIRATGLAAYAATPGNLGAWLLYRIEGERAEVETISMWESMEAIHGFAGEDVERAVFYPEDDRFLVDRDITAHHWVVAGRAP
jgi:heme-degrading monooxygenase HmoA